MRGQDFYMVFVEGGGSPSVRHSALSIAEGEAKRLAKLTGQKVFVLCSVKAIQVNEFLIEDYRPQNDDLPF